MASGQVFTTVDMTSYRGSTFDGRHAIWQKAHLRSMSDLPKSGCSRSRERHHSTGPQDGAPDRSGSTMSSSIPGARPAQSPSDVMRCMYMYLPACLPEFPGMPLAAAPFGLFDPYCRCKVGPSEIKCSESIVAHHLKKRYREFDWRGFPFRRYTDLLHEKRLEAADFIAARPALEMCIVRLGTEQYVWQCSVCGHFDDQRRNLTRHRDGKCPGANTRQVLVCERLCGRLVLKSHLDALAASVATSAVGLAPPALASPSKASVQHSAGTARSSSANTEDMSAQDDIASPKKRPASAPAPGAKSVGALASSSVPVALASSARMRQNTDGTGTSSSKSSSLLSAEAEAAPVSAAALSIVSQLHTSTSAATVPVPRPVVMPRPAISETETIEILWEARTAPFMLPSDKWEIVDNWDKIAVYDWEDNGKCCVGCDPHRNVPVETQWRMISRSGRRGRSMVSQRTFLSWSTFCV